MKPSVYRRWLKPPPPLDPPATDDEVRLLRTVVDYVVHGGGCTCWERRQRDPAARKCMVCLAENAVKLRGKT